MSDMIAVEQWPARLQETIKQRCAMLRRVTVLFETDSTQRSAQRLEAQPGEVIVAWRQTSGHGRLGRRWADTEHDGIAVTIVIHPDNCERLAIASAVGTARGVEAVLRRPVGIKWPNDIMVQQRKLAGILIEQSDSTALIGIGINVSQRQWPDDLSHRAISLAQLESMVDRLVLLEALLPAIDCALQMDDAQLAEEFAKRDALRGATASFRIGAQTFTGRVLGVDPMKGVTIQAEGEQIWLPAATTTLVSAEKMAAPGLDTNRINDSKNAVRTASAARETSGPSQSTIHDSKG